MSWLWWLQIGADLVLIGAVGLLLMRLRSGGGSPRGAAPADLEGFILEAGRLSKEFDRLLGEKRELVRSTLGALDQRIAKLKQAAAELEESPPAPQTPPAPSGASAPAETPSGGMAEFRRKVIKLARQGREPADIARATGRPRGEVELVLELSGGRSNPSRK